MSRLKQVNASIDEIVEKVLSTIQTIYGSTVSEVICNAVEEFVGNDCRPVRLDPKSPLAHARHTLFSSQKRIKPCGPLPRFVIRKNAYVERSTFELLDKYCKESKQRRALVLRQIIDVHLDTQYRDILTTVARKYSN